MRKASNDLLFIFLSTPSGWRATGSSLCRNPALRFLSTPSGWRATGCMRFKDLQAKISIHALRVEGDIFFAAVISYSGKFLSTPSGWRATRREWERLRTRRYFYPRPPGGGRRVESGSAFAHVGISIHALRVEGDVILRHNRDKPFPFLSTPSGWRATIMQKLCDRMGVQFLSTPSGWRATRTLYWLAILSIFLSTPSGWRATADRLTISAARYEFLSTPSGWRATLANKPRFRCKDCDFYPRPPGGGRR